MFPKYELRNSAIYINSKKKIRNYPARFHKQVEILWLKTKSLKVTIDGKQYLMKAGDIYVVFPNVMHSVDSEGGEMIMLVADDEFFAPYHEILSHTVPKVPILRRGEFPPIIYTLFERSYELYRGGPSRRDNVLGGYISAILGEIILCAKLIERSGDNDLVQNLILYLLDNYTREINLDDVARELNYNKYYISHIISDTFKCNFRVLVNSYRISMAQNLLLSSDKTISEISYECGFRNQSSFNRIFLKHCGMTPSEYKRKPDASPEKPVVYEKIVDIVSGRCYNNTVKGKDEEK